MDLHALFTYRDGKLFNNTTRGQAIAGKEAGSACTDGYRKVRVFGKYMLVHRVIWEMHYGPLMSGQVLDHINRDRADNRIENLRLVSIQQNQFNKSRQRDGTSGYKGVWWDSAKRVWKASARTEKGRIYLGQFETEIKAAVAYDKCVMDLHGEFAALNLEYETEEELALLFEE